MAEILYSIASDLVGYLASLGRDEFKFLTGVPEEIQRLRERLERILPALSDFDSGRLGEAAIDVWVKQLRDVVYEAEDVIQGWEFKTKKAAGGPRRHEIGNKVRGINQRLDDLLKDIPFLRLVAGDRRSSGVERRIISRDTSPLVEPDIVGETIEDDATALVDMLISSKGNQRRSRISSKGNQRDMLISSKGNQRRSRISVFAIVGMGGIGKTTLAQKIFNDERIKVEFHSIKPVWKCVSQEFSDIDVLRAIITGLGGIPGEHRTKERLEPMLADIVDDRRVFLVLDDVWDARVWEGLLYKPLQNCSEGSRVLVTTRSDDVATGMRAVHSHQVRKLSDEDGWLLIRKSVLPDVGDLPDNLRDVGMKIVKKCDGLPLALKVVAGVLRNEDMTQRRWEGVLQELSGPLPMLPTGISGALYLSYTELPSHLKQCFLYFALLPEDCVLHMEYVIHMWIAEGFVKMKGDMLMEEVAKMYWEELIHRSLLQPDIRRSYSRYCKMHDLLHSLARYLASNECLCLDVHELGKKSTSSSRLVRRLNIKSSVESISNVITELAPSRTLLVASLKNFNKHDVTSLKCLRILSLEGSSVDNLPSSIGGLICLRYLNISKTSIRKIPKSIGELINLQFLILEHCCNLHDLPKTVVNLSNLRCLCLDGTELHKIPIGIERLNNLVTLLGFPVYGNKEGDRDAKKPQRCTLKELGSLPHLWNLQIKKLEGTTSMEVARAAALEEKHHLTYLHLECTPFISSSDDMIEKIGKTFGELCPPPCIKYLRIEGYFGREYPTWMLNPPSSFLPCMRELHLVNCDLAEQLPPLGLLPQLVILHIQGASAVKIIGSQFFGADNNAYPCHSFPKLKQLRFRDMRNWEEWSWLREGENDDQVSAVLPSLQLLYIEGCPKLKALPDCLRRSPALTELRMYQAHGLTRIENLYSVERLFLNQNRQLEKVLNLPALKEIYIRLDRGGFNSLHSVELSDTLPEWLEEMRFLQKLVVDGVNTKLLSRCLQGGQEWHKIERIGRFDAYAYRHGGSGYYIHYTRSPFSFDTNLTINDDGEIADQVGGSSNTATSCFFVFCSGPRVPAYYSD